MICIYCPSGVNKTEDIYEYNAEIQISYISFEINQKLEWKFFLTFIATIKYCRIQCFKKFQTLEMCASSSRRVSELEDQSFRMLGLKVRGKKLVLNKKQNTQYVITFIANYMTSLRTCRPKLQKHREICSSLPTSPINL